MRVRTRAQVGEGRALTEGEVQDLARIRRILCLPSEVARRAQRETAGKLLEEAIRCGGRMHVCGGACGQVEAGRSGARPPGEGTVSTLWPRGCRLITRAEKPGPGLQSAVVCAALPVCARPAATFT